MRSVKSDENIHKKEGGSYHVVSANKVSSVTLQSPGNESERKHAAILRILNRQSIQRLYKTKWMDELGFYVLSTVFQSFRDDGRVSMKGSVQ